MLRLETRRASWLRYCHYVRVTLGPSLALGVSGGQEAGRDDCGRTGSLRKIAVIAGDGVGPEVVEQGLGVLADVAGRARLSLRISTWGASVT